MVELPVLLDDPAQHAGVEPRSAAAARAPAQRRLGRRPRESIANVASSTAAPRRPACPARPRERQVEQRADLQVLGSRRTGLFRARLRPLEQLPQVARVRSPASRRSGAARQSACLRAKPRSRRASMARSSARSSARTGVEVTRRRSCATAALPALRCSASTCCGACRAGGAGTAAPRAAPGPAHSLVPAASAHGSTAQTLIRWAHGDARRAGYRDTRHGPGEASACGARRGPS